MPRLENNYKNMDISKLIKLKAEEEILMITQQHPVPFVPRMVVFLALFVVPFFLMFPLFSLGEVGVLIFVVVLLLAVFLAARSWNAWQNTVFVVTDRRMIDIDQHGFFSRVISELFYSGVDDVTYYKKGISPTVFGYGTVLIQTSGSADDIEVRRVSNPARLADLINEIREAVMNEEPKDPKTRKLYKVAKGMDEGEVEEVVRDAEKKFRKRAFDNFFEGEE